MSVKDYLVIGFILCLIFFGVFHQLASRIIVKSSELRKSLYGFDLFKNKSMDIPNIQAVMSVITVINIQYFLYAKNNPEYIFFKRRKHPLFTALDTKAAVYIVRNYRKLNFYIILQGVFGVLFLLFGVFFIFLK
ncbi:hypothetical protein [Acinetobacter sp. YK3]|uniref:hypothetical protein n=1 Tax=Acinetobacter sp. YK3 TaxID=1860097 RepID=UPI00084CA73B|nr:hypothetical protein [Acinetobacter sp. YK3]OEC92593.1 hypothetical protein A9Z07_14230 [Acinetobacter sp. YK3]